jgi:hypothetical protein
MATQILRPNATGALSQWAYPVFTAHYLEVDEASQDGDTTKVMDDGVVLPNGDNTRDIYNLDAWSHGSQYISKVEVTFYERLTTGGGKITPLLYLDNTVQLGTPVTLSVSGSYSSHTEDFTSLRPNGGNWHWSDLDSLQVGLETSHGTGVPKLGDHIRCTQVYVTITYSPYFDEITALGHCADWAAYPTLILTDDDSDLSGGDDFDYKALRTTGSAANIVYAIAGSATEDSYWYTEPSDPLNDDWETGSILVALKMYGNATHSNIRIRVRFSQIDDDGTFQTATSWSGWVNSPWNADDVHIFIWNAIGWFSSDRTDRIRIDLQAENLSAGSLAYGIKANDGSSYVKTNIHLWKTDTINATGHVLQNRSETIQALGHILQERSTTIEALGHILQERSEDIQGIGHILQGRSDTIQAVGHILQERSDTIQGLGHITETRSAPIQATGHVFVPSPSPSPSPFPSPETREDTIQAIGHVLQERSDTIQATGHILQIRSAPIQATGYVGRRKKTITLLDITMLKYLFEYLTKIKEDRARKAKEKEYERIGNSTQ